jgi:hypothetical protein
MMAGGTREACRVGGCHGRFVGFGCFDSGGKVQVGKCASVSAYRDETISVDGQYI